MTITNHSQSHRSQLYRSGETVNSFIQTVISDLVLSYLLCFLCCVRYSPAGEEVSQEEGVDQSRLTQPRLANHQDHKMEAWREFSETVQMFYVLQLL